MKLLLTTDAVGGVWQYSLELGRSLTSHGIEPVLALLGPAPSDEQRRQASGLPLVETGLPLDWLAASPEDVIAAGQAISRLATRERVDLVQLNSPALAAATRFDVPVVAVSHSCIATWWKTVLGGEPDADFDWRAKLHGQGLHAADLVVAPSAAFAGMTRRAYGLPRLPLAVHNGRTPLALPEVAPHDYAFTVGRLWDKGKNVATLDRAAAALPVPLYAAGSTRGPNGDSIAFEHARPLGSVSEAELGRWLAPRPVFVSAALYEPFGLAVLEAAQAGCPLVLSDIPTFRELWDGAATFVDPLDHAGFAAAIERIASEGSARIELGAAARERAACYTPEATARAMLDVYRSLLAGSDARRAAA
jgi:glycosyltransferase involved in cell wall biosynthesis